MEITQKNREQAVRQRNPQEAAQRPRKQRPASEGAAPPPSAQQNNGAVRSPEEQRSSAAVKRQRPAEETTRERKATPRKTAAPVKKAAVKKADDKDPAKKKPVSKDKVKASRPPRKLEAEGVPQKKRAYGNSKPKKNAVSTVSDMLKKNAEKNEAKNRKKKNRPKQPTPAVIYTQPQAFNRNRLLIQLATVTAVVAALVFGLAVFFKVETITVTGAEKYAPHKVAEYSGIKEGDNLLTFSRPRAGALIKANLPYVDTVRFGIKLPGTVNIIIEEDDVVYAIKDQNETWWLINSDGRVVEQGTGSKAANHTQVLGVNLDNPVVDTIGVAVEEIPTETIAGGEPAPVTVTNARRLAAALEILKALEDNDIVGSAANVDVSRLDDIILWYGTRYQVNLGDDSRLDDKIAYMNDVILQLSDYQSGILDISFTIWPNQVGYTPFA